MNIVFACDRYVIANKPHGLPTVPLASDKNADGTLLGEVASQYPQVLTVFGKNRWEGGALHRLDNATSGLVLFALDQAFYNEIWQSQLEGNFLKTYRAEINNSSLKLPASVSTYFRAFGRGRKLVKPETDIKKADSQVLYTTYIKRLSDSELECTISRGFRHQIRSHLAYLGCPIVGDELYCGVNDTFLHLECRKIEFKFNGKTFCYTL